MIHPVAFARYWAWHLAAEHKSIPPITNNWVTLIRYVSAHLQYLGRDEREWFADELRRLRGLLGALVNENGLSQGEAEDLQKVNARQAREELRSEERRVGKEWRTRGGAEDRKERKGEEGGRHRA